VSIIHVNKKYIAKLIKRRKGAKALDGFKGNKGYSIYSIYSICSLFLLPLPIKINLAMESTRQKKVSRLIQKELADIFLKKGNEFAHGKLVSITRVRLSPDLSFAKVYLSIFPATNQDDILKAIEEHSSKIRFELGQKVRTQLRIVPEIAFHIDDSLDYIDKIDKLLKS
jgi:ribosome-binding factor A